MWHDTISSVLLFLLVLKCWEIHKKKSTTEDPMRQISMGFYARDNALKTASFYMKQIGLFDIRNDNLIDNHLLLDSLENISSYLNYILSLFYFILSNKFSPLFILFLTIVTITSVYYSVTWYLLLLFRFTIIPIGLYFWILNPLYILYPTFHDKYSVPIVLNKLVTQLNKHNKYFTLPLIQLNNDISFKTKKRSSHTDSYSSFDSISNNNSPNTSTNNTPVTSPLVSRKTTNKTKNSNNNNNSSNNSNNSNSNNQLRQVTDEDEIISETISDYRELIKGLETKKVKSLEQQDEVTEYERIIKEYKKAIKEGNAALVNDILDENSKYQNKLLEYKNEEGKTSFHITCELGYLFVADILFDFKIDPNIKDKEGRTGLLLSIINKHYHVALMLCDQPSVDVTLQDNLGNNVFHYIANNEYAKELPEIFRALIDRGASIDHFNNEGQSPLQIALEKSKYKLT